MNYCKHLIVCLACPDYTDEITGKAVYNSIEYSRNRNCKGERFERAGAYD